MTKKPKPVVNTPPGKPGALTPVGILKSVGSRKSMALAVAGYVADYLFRRQRDELEAMDAGFDSLDSYELGRGAALVDEGFAELPWPTRFVDFDETQAPMEVDEGEGGRFAHGASSRRRNGPGPPAPVGHGTARAHGDRGPHAGRPRKSTSGLIKRSAGRGRQLVRQLEAGGTKSCEPSPRSRRPPPSTTGTTRRCTAITGPTPSLSRQASRPLK